MHYPYGDGQVTACLDHSHSCLGVHRVFAWGFGLLGLGPNLTTAKTPQEIPQVLFGR